MKLLVILANFFAKGSLPRWNKCRPLRKISREIFYWMVNCYAKRYRHKYLVTLFTGQFVDTYPPLLKEVAHWEEDDRPRSYSLMSDPAGFVVRRSPSYVAWKICELTGAWPMERGNDGTIFHAKNWQEFLPIFHAKNWQEFLRLNGYGKVVDRPVRGGRYVGIVPDEGEFGQVVWFECIDPLSFPKELRYIVSTYKDFQYTIERDYDITKAIWVEIC